MFSVVMGDCDSCPACGARIWLVDQVTDPVSAQRELMRMGRVANVIALLGVAIDQPVAHQRISLTLESIGLELLHNGVGGEAPGIERRDNLSQSQR